MQHIFVQVDTLTSQNMTHHRPMGFESKGVEKKTQLRSKGGDLQLSIDI